MSIEGVSTLWQKLIKIDHEMRDTPGWLSLVIALGS